MERTAVDVVLILLAYGLGSLSSAIIVCRLMGLPDPRTQGSGNPGATNVLRVGGKGAAAVTLLGDTLKGVIPVALAQLAAVEVAVLAAVALAAFLGHLYPVFFGFRGGKGVATALGVLLAASWTVGLATVATWLAMFALFRISSLSALTAFLVAPLYTWWLEGEPVLAGTVALITVLLFWRHRSNIRNLLAGTEGRLKERS
ncbi:MAG: glycerol-3-phosphate 1-O-acyltransferase PlsY [Gammaproteobacteria bacterium]|nr:glycerol-3-phosphate 1-O-acyltransferase PlsY [Gammaproteobacteria bacterium]NIR98625.1 glycerol-3-phosphate 1-O-acyltransferase PlsY [Gammaproteobacteria bacterium]NIT64348.1 glycerol-3-phosphate 1-O-acyltransferase PlsY [Gammaproteobacteria bacterium]NIV21272.1 glycerol-3-phosphate 1-O-acyltransferase PlsY [Gammaproteobacteria bacterium]NIX10976.1 glycerol-3-phosphate 1-O-acyltransferase PlsY [Gammaproteobacteria bacterium]